MDTAHNGVKRLDNIIKKEEGVKLGDRANVRIKTKGEADLYLYTHWCGTELPLTVRNALMGKARWSDGPYLTRIIFCEMVHGQEKEETGFGISSYICDNEHNIIEINPDEQSIAFVSEAGQLIKKWPFEEYIGLPDRYIQDIYQGRDDTDPEDEIA
jgi:hypothetical protein